MVGKYVDLTESYKSLSEALTHAGIHTRSKVHIHYVDSEAVERDGIDCLAGMDAILVPGRLRQARRRRQDQGDPLRARERRPVSRHLPRHAARGDRVRAAQGRAGRREQHRIRSGDAASGGRADHRMAEPRRLDREAHRELRPRRHDAARRAALRRRAGIARAPRSTARRRSRSVTAIATRSTTIICRGSRRPVSASARARRAQRPATSAK